MARISDRCRSAKYLTALTLAFIACAPSAPAAAAEFVMKFGTATFNETPASVHQVLQGGRGKGVRRANRGRRLSAQRAWTDPAHDRRPAARHDRSLYRAGRLLRRRRPALRRLQRADPVQAQRSRVGDRARSRAQRADPRPRRAQGLRGARHVRPRLVQLRGQEPDPSARPISPARSCASTRPPWSARRCGASAPPPCRCRSTRFCHRCSAASSTAR